MQMAVFSRMTGGQRVRIAMQLSEDVLRMTADGIRKRHPDYDDDSVRWAVRRIQVGDDLFRAAWPTAPMVDP